MPTRDEMIRDLMNASQSSLPAKGGMAAPSREQMIKDLMAHKSASKPPGVGETLAESTNTGLRSALETITLGASEPVLSGMNALTNQGYRAIVGDDADPRNQFNLENLKRSYDDDVEKRRSDKKNYGYADFAGSISGAFVPIGPGARLAQGATEAATAGVSRLASRAPESLASNAVSRGAGKIAQGAVQGATSGVASEAVRQPIEKATGFIRDGEAPGLLDVAESGLKWGAGIAAVPQAWNAAKWGGKQLVSVVLGPKVEVIDKYLANAERIKKARSVEDIKTEMDGLVRGLADDVNQGHLSQEEAESTLKAIQQEIKDVKGEAGRNFDRMRFEIKSQLQESKQKLSDSTRAQKEQLKAVRAPIDLAGDVGDVIAKQKQRVSEGASAAYSALDNDPNAYGVRGAARLLRQMADEMNIQPFETNGIAPAGAVRPGAPVTAQTEGVQRELLALAERLERTPERISARELKKVLRQLDDSGKAMYGQPGFDSRVSQAYKMVRGTIDDAVKANNPEYAKRMKGVAEDMGLLEEAISRFGDPHARVSKLSGIHRDTSGMDRELLTRLSEKNGGRFTSDIDAFVDAQRTLSNPAKLRQMERSSPEYRDYRLKSINDARVAHPDAARNYVDTEVGKTGLLGKQDEAVQRITEAEKVIAQREAALEPFRSLQSGTESKIRALMQENPRSVIDTRNTVKALDEAKGTNFIQEIDDRRVMDTFNKGNTNGSRNVNLFALMGAAGATGGVVAGPVGAFAGAAAGAVVDKYGPRMARSILDATLKIKGTPTVQKIQSLNLPPDVKNYLSTQLVKHQGEAIGSGASRIAGPSELDTDSSRSSNFREPEPAPTPPKKGQEKWMDDGFKKLESHGASDISQYRDELVKSSKGKRLLIAASDLKPNTKAMDRVVAQIKSEFGKGRN